jgi:hypothetical protein
VGDIRFYDFISLGPLGGTQIPEAGIAVNASGGGLTASLEFVANAAAGPGELLEARIGYTLQAPGPLLARLAMTGSSASGDGVTTVVERFCLGDAFAGDFCFGPEDALIVIDPGFDPILSESKALPLVVTLGVIKEIAVDGGTAGSATIGSAINQFVIVPEPGTMLLGVSALMACVWLRARRRSQ